MCVCVCLSCWNEILCDVVFCVLLLFTSSTSYPFNSVFSPDRRCLFSHLWRATSTCDWTATVTLTSSTKASWSVIWCGLSSTAVWLHYNDIFTLHLFSKCFHPKLLTVSALKYVVTTPKKKKSQIAKSASSVPFKVSSRFYSSAMVQSEQTSFECDVDVEFVPPLWIQDGKHFVERQLGNGEVIWH